MKPGSIPTWDDMVDVFYTKYFHGEETVMLATWQGTKQKNGENLMKYIKRFRDIAPIAKITIRRRRWWKCAWVT